MYSHRVRLPLAPRRFGLPAAAFGAACALVAGPVLADDPAPAPATVLVSATSQCVEGPGAPPADPSKVTRVVPGQPAAPAGAPSAAGAPVPPEEPSLDEPPSPGAPSRVLLEAGLFAGVSVRFDDPAFLETTRRAGLAVGGSVFVWPSRLLSFGVAYAHADLHRAENPKPSIDSIVIEHDAHTLLGEARVIPFRFSTVALFASIGGGLAWQTASLRAAFVPVNGSPGGSIRCSVGSGAEFAFRAALGMKARVSRAVSLLADASFVGYRLSGDVLDGCAPGAGTAQTLMVRAGFTYDIDISGFVR